MSSLSSSTISSRQLLVAGRQWLVDRHPYPITTLYLILITLAEMLTTFYPLPGIVMHVTLLTIFLVHAGLAWEGPDGRLILTLTLAPMIRIVSFSLPLIGFKPIYWYMLTSIPLFISTFLVIELIELKWMGRVKPTPKHIVGQIMIMTLGVGLGAIEYQILRPRPLYEGMVFPEIILPALILLISTGLLEELIFRRVMQVPAIDRLGTHWGIWYAAAIFAVLHIGYESIIDVVFVMSVGVLFGYLVFWTDSLLGVTVAHGLTNIFLFLVMPFVALEFGIGVQPERIVPERIDEIPTATPLPPLGVPIFEAPTLPAPLRLPAGGTAVPPGTVVPPTVTPPASGPPATFTPVPTMTPVAWYWDDPVDEPMLVALLPSVVEN